MADPRANSKKRVLTTLDTFLDDAGFGTGNEAPAPPKTRPSRYPAPTRTDGSDQGRPQKANVSDDHVPPPASEAEKAARTAAAPGTGRRTASSNAGKTAHGNAASGKGKKNPDEGKTKGKKPDPKDTRKPSRKKDDGGDAAIPPAVAKKQQRKETPPTRKQPSPVDDGSGGNKRRSGKGAVDEDTDEAPQGKPNNDERVGRERGEGPNEKGNSEDGDVPGEEGVTPPPVFTFESVKQVDPITIRKGDVRGLIGFPEGSPFKRKDEDASMALLKLTGKIYNDLAGNGIPFLELSSRTKSNIEFDEGLRVWKYGDALTRRSAMELGSAYNLLRTLHVSEFITKDMISRSKTSTLREMYYVSETWKKAKFSSQDESNNLAEDLEIMTGCLREEFHLRPEEDGARVIGNITLEELNRKGQKKKINCQDDVGDSGYTIPYNVGKEKITFRSHDVDFVIAIETGGMFDRLVENGFAENYRALLVHLKGQPARATRRFIKRLNEEQGLPVIVFTDGDPWSFRIYGSIAYGAIKTAHISEYLATPDAQFLGITPSDIKEYELPSDTLTKQDTQALKAELDDPRFATPFWEKEIKLQLKMGQKAEQQALAKYGLDFVTDTYLPEKLQKMDFI